MFILTFKLCASSPKPLHILFWISLRFCSKIAHLRELPPNISINRLLTPLTITKEIGIVTVDVNANKGHFTLLKKSIFFFVTKCSIVSTHKNIKINIKATYIADTKNPNTWVVVSILISCILELKNILPISAPQQNVKTL